MADLPLFVREPGQWKGRGKIEVDVTLWHLEEDVSVSVHADSTMTPFLHITVVFRWDLILIFIILDFTVT